MLHWAEKVPRSSQPQILSCNFKAVGCTHHGVNSRLGVVGFAVADKYAVGLELADQVCSILTREDVEFEGIYIEDAKIMSASEDFIDNEGFIQRMTITFRILNN